MFGAKTEVALHSFVNVLNATELVASRGFISCYVNFTSIFLKDQPEDPLLVLGAGGQA